MLGVIGRRCFGDEDTLTVALALATPVCRSFRRGIVVALAGSGNPFVIWAWRTPAK